VYSLIKNIYPYPCFFIIGTLLLAKLKETLNCEKEHACFDFLTCALNSLYFHKLKQKELDHSRRYYRSITIGIFDLDNYKLVNNQFGLQTGDKVHYRKLKILPKR